MPEIYFYLTRNQGSVTIWPDYELGCKKWKIIRLILQINWIFRNLKDLTNYSFSNQNNNDEQTPEEIDIDNTSDIKVTIRNQTVLNP